MYCKFIDKLDTAISLMPLSEKDRANYKNPDNDPRGPWVSSDFTAQGFRPNQMYKIITPSGAEYYPPAGTCWKNVEEIYLQQAAEGRFSYGSDGSGMPRRKTYLNEKQGRNIWTWWPNSEVGHTQEATKELKSLFPDQAAVFDFPKPTRLIERMVSIATSGDDIILDFFSGSATTAHAVMQLNTEDGGNRRFILVQLPEVCDEKSEAAKAGYPNICEIGRERIRRAGTKLKETLMRDGGNFRYLAKKLPSAERKGINIDGHVFNIPEIPARWSKADESEDNARMADLLDIGFRVFKLDSSNLKTWDATPIDSQVGDVIGELADRMNAMIHRVKPDRSDLDMVFEVMLKLGVPLDFPVSPVSINGKTAYTVGEDCLLLVCLAENVQPEDVEKMAEYAPAKTVISRDSFADDTAMSNAYYILRDRGVELKLV